MNKYKKTPNRIVVMAIFILLLTTGLYALGQGDFEYDENINEKRFYDLDNIKDLDIRVSSAEIRIKVVNSDKLKVHLHGSSSGQKPFLDDKESGSNLTIEVKRKSNIGFSRSNLILDIEIPKGYDRNLEFNNSSGDITLPDLELKDLRINISSGDLNMGNIAVRNFIYDSSSGNLTVNRIESSQTELIASSGSIIIDNFSGNLEVKMSSGNLKVKFVSFNNKVSVDNSSGDITISLPEGANFELYAETSSGKIICDYPITISGEQDRNQLKGTVGSGENRIHVETSSGDISILKK